MKPKIEEIIVNLDESKILLESTSNKKRQNLIRKYLGGFCTRCMDIPTKKISYDVGDAKLIEFYCDLCYQKHKNELDKILQNINFA